MAPIDPRGLNYIAVDARVEEVLIRRLDKPTKSRAKNGSNLGLVERLKGHTILEEYTAISTGSKGKASHYVWYNTTSVWLSNILPHKLDKNMDKASPIVREIAVNAVRKFMGLTQEGEKPPQDFLAEVILMAAAWTLLFTNH